MPRAEVCGFATFTGAVRGNPCGCFGDPISPELLPRGIRISLGTPAHAPDHVGFALGDWRALPGSIAASGLAGHAPGARRHYDGTWLSQSVWRITSSRPACRQSWSSNLARIRFLVHRIFWRNLDFAWIFHTSGGFRRLCQSLGRHLESALA